MKRLGSSTLLVALFLMTPSAEAQRTADIPNGQDHPAISRFKGSVLEYHNEAKWGQYKLPVGPKGDFDFDKPTVFEGRVVRTQYSAPLADTPEFILRNYQAAFKKAGFAILASKANEQLGFQDRVHTWQNKYYDTGGFYNGIGNEKFGFGLELPVWKTSRAFIAARGNVGGKELVAAVYIVPKDAYTTITQDVIELESADTGNVTVESISKDISAKGFVAIYGIHFDTGKSDIKSGSEAALKSIAEYVNAAQGKAFFVVGHTDDVGDLEANMSLAKARAAAIVEALTKEHAVAAGRLLPHGVGPLSPASTNASEDGRALNRRVELVERFVGSPAAASPAPAAAKDAKEQMRLMQERQAELKRKQQEARDKQAEMLKKMKEKKP
ncbi:MAG: OmpA family protein [Elusimicrobiota bacterium]|jgi:outer membrane protein OmpA-like peptidoglycan-associated protein